MALVSDETSSRIGLLSDALDRVDTAIEDSIGALEEERPKEASTLDAETPDPDGRRARRDTKLRTTRPEDRFS